MPLRQLTFRPMPRHCHYADTMPRPPHTLSMLLMPASYAALFFMAAADSSFRYTAYGCRR